MVIIADLKDGLLPGTEVWNEMGDERSGANA